MSISISQPKYSFREITEEDASISKLAADLKLIKHPNGGYFNETDRANKKVSIDKDQVRNESTLIHFLMTCESPIGKFHTNIQSRTIHILQKGRGVYILIHPNGEIETFRVGFDIANGERTQWIVEPGTYKACYIIPEGDAEDSNKDCLWVSEVVVPGFDFQDMKFPTLSDLTSLVGEKTALSIDWLI
ncbi:hypothetical protein C6P40_001718 [Pichia californica]|uniref:DUF985 domain-containing protein n=1 Tax=Pichia californica TaxID=460514 RepID=A0A9P7BFB0_9ASCO|nr:hypothetical protein C6P42_000654 [[Candida] californica]KAG0687905.1 hypothetical protein C6P40_001718 [[Candida] californica]